MYVAATGSLERDAEAGAGDRSRPMKSVLTVKSVAMTTVVALSLLAARCCLLMSRGEALEDGVKN